MDYVFDDYNDSDAHFAAAGSTEWSDLEEILDELPLCMQASDQAGKRGSPIFDPKATNARLTEAAKKRGWSAPVPVPAGLTEFGNDWDAGKNATLAEWQFSNYPFLWNNVIRTEAVHQKDIPVEPLTATEALVVVTKAGLFPASNSTLYYEQAQAQLALVTGFSVFDTPIRLVGLTIPDDAETVSGIWSEYPNRRYSREPDQVHETNFHVSWGSKRKYDYRAADFSRQD